jgi:OHCU decarboxylase
MTERAAVSVADLDVMPAAAAAPLLDSCCGSREWVRRMLGRRPFGSADALLRSADEVWWALERADWLEAFAHHPRIGERDSAAPQDARARAWSAGEQLGVARADAGVRASLADGNREYERRFGHIYIVCASGRSAEEMLAFLRERLANDAATELRVAAGEQAKITRLRLLKLVGADARASAPA